MKPQLRALFFVAVPAVLGLAAGGAAPAPPSAPAADTASKADAGAATGRGIAILERANSGVGLGVGLGVVLAQDGRVLCALSALDGHGTVELRYAEGGKVQAEVVEKDPETDLALLRPIGTHSTAGLPPGHAELSNDAIRAWVLVEGHLRALPVAVLPEDGGADSLLAVEVKGAPGHAISLGAPLVDGAGNVVAILTHPCPALAAHCRGPVRAASTTTVRQFLSRLLAVDASASSPEAPAADAAPPPPRSSPAADTTAKVAPWLGIRAETDVSGSTHGVRVLDVAPASPASKAKLHARGAATAGDLVVAVDGTLVETPEQLAELIAAHAVGDELRLLVMTSDRFHDVLVTLQAAPGDGARKK